MSLLESREQREHQRESLVAASFTVFSVFMAYVALKNAWSPIIVPIVAAELAFVWWSYTTSFMDYMTRALIVTFIAGFNIFFYGMNVENYMVVIPTLCVFAVLFSIYQLRPAMDIVVGTQILLLLYHLLVNHSLASSSTGMEVERTVMYFLALLFIDALCMYLIQREQGMEDDLAELANQVGKAQKIKDDFVANTSHELRTPINTISGMSDILLQEDLSETAHSRALDIQMTSIELQTTISDILDYAALEAGTHTLSPRAYNITSTINDVMNMTVFQNRDKNLQLIFNCDPHIPCLLYGDEQQLRRVMNNLIGNAIKFTNEGGVVVTVGYRPESYGVNLIVSIRDTGIGMSSESMEKIFQDFYQVDPERNRSVEGIGLGLTISSALIKMMGGFLTVRSQEGRGSEFTFSIPQEVRDSRPCIAVAHPESVRAIWYFNSEVAEPHTRDDYINHISKIAENLEIYIHRASTLSELKRRLRQGNFTHLFIGMEEYEEDPHYFDEVAMHTPSILVLDRRYEAPHNRMHTLYTPYNAITLAELFNGGDIVANPRKYQQVRFFEAPTAKILVVDDNLMNLKVVEGLLRKYRIKITAAVSGEEALAQIESQDYDFVFMDHMMPGMDGIECFRKIRTKPGEYYSKVPIIALTANAIGGAREMFLEEGFAEFLAKPINNAALSQILEEFIPDEKKIFGQASEGSEPASEEVPARVPASPVDPFEAMEGIHIDTALTYCGGSLEDYADLARVFCDGAPKNMEDIQSYFDTQDWKNYAILVHALKSSAKTIGAIDLSDMAYIEEMASKGGEEATVRRHHESMMTEYRRIIDVLRANPRIYEQTPASEAGVEAEAASVEEEKSATAGASIDGEGGLSASREVRSLSHDEWNTLSAELRELLATFEADAVEDYICQRSHYLHQGKALPDLLKPVMINVGAFDFAAAIQELDAIGGAQ